MRNSALSLIAICALAAPVAATPPHVIWVKDRLFAENGSAVMILRTIHDNQGSHYITQSDTFLLTLSLVDGAVIDVAAIERVVNIDLGEAALDSTTFTELAQPVNPYAARASAGFAPLLTPDREYSPPAMIHPLGILITEGDELTHRLPVHEAQIQMQSALSATRAVLPLVYPEGSETDTFDPSAYDVARDCEVQNAMRFWQLDGPKPAIVNLSCSGMDETGQLDIWLVVPEISGS